MNQANVIASVRLEISTPEAIITTYEIYSPSEDPDGTWVCLLRETTNGVVRDRALAHVSSYGALSIAVNTVRLLVNRISSSLEDADNLVVDGFPYLDWAGLRIPPDDVLQGSSDSMQDELA